MSSQPVPFVTPEEYLEFDRNSETRHEYIFGEIVPVLAATPWHSLIVANSIAALHARLSDGPCLVFDASVRVSLDRRAVYGYPDITVVCSQLEYVDAKKDTITNPKLVIEVLSPRTRNYDLGGKARAYFEIPSLGELLLIEQDRIQIEHWRRMPEGLWYREVVKDRQATIQIESISCELPVLKIYERVVFPELS